MKEKKDNKHKVRISFFGGTGEVTGSNYMVESLSGKSGSKMAVDCGLFQGTRVGEERNNEPFPYDPKSLKALIVTHAHLDHIGRIPKLVRDGFNGEIYSTAPTRDFAKLMLVDSIGVLSKEAKHSGKNSLIYTEEDVNNAMALWRTKNYGEDFTVGEFSVRFKDAGHILGSAFAEITGAGNAESKKIVFSGDLGNSPEPLLNLTEEVKDAVYMVVESTYGDRLHEDSSEADVKLERVIEETVKNNGVLMIPAFSLERTQRLLFQMNSLVENGRIPRVSIFLDSPLSIGATGVYKNYVGFYNGEAKNEILKGDDLFNFPGLKSTLSTEESKTISGVPTPKIIIAGAGMCNGGRILHHLKNYLPHKNSSLLLVSYQAAGSLGRMLQDGARLVKIMGEEVPVEAKVEKIGGYSSHADANGLIEFVSKSADTLKKVFVAHGEPKSSLFLTQRIRDYLGVDAVVPQIGESFVVEI